MNFGSFLWQKEQKYRRYVIPPLWKHHEQSSCNICYIHRKNQVVISCTVKKFHRFNQSNLPRFLAEYGTPQQLGSHQSVPPQLCKMQSPAKKIQSQFCVILYTTPSHTKSRSCCCEKFHRKKNGPVLPSCAEHRIKQKNVPNHKILQLKTKPTSETSKPNKRTAWGNKRGSISTDQKRPRKWKKKYFRSSV